MVSSLRPPTAGRISVLDEDPIDLGRVGFVAQDTPNWSALSIADHVRMGKELNPGWDSTLASGRIADLGLDPGQRAGRLSGGQRAQLALTLAIAKRPELLILDEPTAALDPLARRDFARSLMEIVADHGVSVILSSHLLADLERICDHLVVLVSSQVRLSGDVDDLLACHHRLVGPRRDTYDLPAGQELIEASHTARQSTLLVRTSDHILDPAWQVERVGLEDLVLAYMARASTSASARSLTAVA